MKEEKLVGVSREDQSGDDVVGLLVGERQSLDILFVKKDAKQLASEVPRVDSKGDKDFRCKSLLTDCHGRLGFPEDEETRSL